MVASVIGGIVGAFAGDTVASKAMRIDSLYVLVGRYGIDLKPTLSNGHHKPMIDALYNGHKVNGRRLSRPT